MFVARAVEGLRVKAGEDAQADLEVIKGRRFRGMAIDSVGNKPMAGAPIFYYSLSHPRSGPAYEYDFRRAGPFRDVRASRAGVRLRRESGGLSDEATRKNLIVPDDRDPEPVILERRYASGADSSQIGGRPDECAVQVRVAAGDTGQGLEGRV